MAKLPETMKALVAYSPDKYIIETAWPRPVAGPGEIVLKVEACGVCAGDVKARHGAERFWNNFVVPPFIPGPRRRRSRCWRPVGFRTNSSLR
jgi:D-arabinose 1-dehydrogenase-like Zn-dependent alcohol dehydrogenase